MLLALRMGLREVQCLHLDNLLVEGDSSCVTGWASMSSSSPWRFVDIVEEIRDLAYITFASSHVKRQANTAANMLLRTASTGSIC